MNTVRPTRGKGARQHFERRELPDVRGGARLWQVTDGPSMHYLPYFYNPHLDPSASHLIYCGDVSGGTEQAFVLDVTTGVSTQLTDAAGRDQHWSPYIRHGIDGIRPQFIAWSQPDWQHVLYWEGNTLRRVNVTSLEDEPLHDQPGDAVPQVLHCSAQGLVCWGYIPREVQEGIRTHLAAGGRMEWTADLLSRLERGCGFVVYDLAAGRMVLDVQVPFWVNHIQASPDGRRILFCQEGPWQRQRMWLYEVARGEWGPLRIQEDGAAIGHEFWLDATTVAYHGSLPLDGTSSTPAASASAAVGAPAAAATPLSGGLDGARPVKRGFFGHIDVTTGACNERPSSEGEQYYGHYHASPTGEWIVTDGEITPDWVSIAHAAPGAARPVHFETVGLHGWARAQDQRHHPHPHWHQSGDYITFTGCNQDPDGRVGTHPLLLDVRALTTVPGRP